jgi:hypothetical protein
MKKTQRTNVALVVDESGSMRPFRSAVIEQMEKQEEAIPRGDTLIKIRFNQTVREGNFANYTPGGDTALWDAVDLAITRVDDGETPALIIVLTDGMENASQRVDISDLRNRIARKQATDRFTFVFMVPYGYKRRLATLLGIPAGNVTEWEQTDEDFARVSHDTAIGTQSYFTSRTLGATHVTNFYTDLSGITPKDVRSALMEITALTKVWTVGGECEIRDFVEERGHVYKPGTTYYQLTKPEKVQTYKRILLMEKGKRMVFGGSNVRNMIGLPSHVEAKVIPGNHANYDIFVESRSFNRKLVRGTRVIYYSGR